MIWININILLSFSYRKTVDNSQSSKHKELELSPAAHSYWISTALLWAEAAVSAHLS